MKKVAETIEYFHSLSGIVAAYEEIAAVRMQKIRQNVLYNRDFMAELNNIFQQVRFSYQKQIEKYRIVLSQDKNKRGALVFISTNAGLYGDIVFRIFGVFKKDLLASQNSEAIILGQVGKKLFEEAKIPQPATYFEFPDNTIDALQIKKIVEFLRNFGTVTIYHGLFRNIINQEVAASNITGDEIIPGALLARLAGKPLPVKPIKIIFEPSLIELLDFFEKEIFVSLFVQMIYEAQLAKYSSRMTSLDNASQNIEKAGKAAAQEANRERHRLINRKQMILITSRVTAQP